jgi:hypothetical protein
MGSVNAGRSSPEFNMLNDPFTMVAQCASVKVPVFFFSRQRIHELKSLSLNLPGTIEECNYGGGIEQQKLTFSVILRPMYSRSRKV